MDTVDNIAHHVNGNYARRQNVPHVKQAAAEDSVNAGNESLSMHDDGRTQDLLQVLGNVDATALDRQDRALFLEAWEACETLQGLGPDQVPNGGTSTYETFVEFKPRFTAIVDAANEEQQASTQGNETSEKPITIVSLDSQKFTMAVGCHFVVSIAFLTRLRLQAGDVIKPDVKSNVTSKAIEFYDMSLQS